MSSDQLRKPPQKASSAAASRVLLSLACHGVLLLVALRVATDPKGNHVGQAADLRLTLAPDLLAVDDSFELAVPEVSALPEVSESDPDEAVVRDEVDQDEAVDFDAYERQWEPEKHREPARLSARLPRPLRWPGKVRAQKDKRAAIKNSAHGVRALVPAKPRPKLVVKHRGPTRPPSLLDKQGGQVIYPARARRLGHEGRIVMRMLVSATGAVRRVEVVHSSGHRDLDQVATLAVKRWRFRPALRNGRPVSAWIRHAVRFRLTS